MASSDLERRVKELELTIQALNTNYFNRNWSSNFELLQLKDLGFSLVVGQSPQPLTSVSGIQFTLNTTTTILSTSGGPNGGGSVEGIWLGITTGDAATSGPKASLVLTVDNFVTTIPVKQAGVNQQLDPLIQDMMVKGVAANGLLLMPGFTFQNSLLVQLQFDGSGSSIAANTFQVVVLWTKSTS